MTGEKEDIIGYALFSRFPLAGRHQNELLMLGTVAVKTELQRQHISKAARISGSVDYSFYDMLTEQ